jgi:hypothetical protein
VGTLDSLVQVALIALGIGLVVLVDHLAPH